MAIIYEYEVLSPGTQQCPKTSFLHLLFSKLHVRIHTSIDPPRRLIRPYTITIMNAIGPEGNVILGIIISANSQHELLRHPNSIIIMSIALKFSSSAPGILQGHSPVKMNSSYLLLADVRTALGTLHHFLNESTF